MEYTSSCVYNNHCLCLYDKKKAMVFGYDRHGFACTSIGENMKLTCNSFFEKFNDAVDKLVLVLYVFMLFFQMMRYYTESDKDEFILMYNIVFVALFVIALYKILINLESNIVFSAFAIVLIGFSVYCILVEGTEIWSLVFDWHNNVLNTSVLMVAMYGIRFTEIAGVFLVTRGVNVIIRVVASLCGFIPITEGNALFVGKEYVVSTYGFGSKNNLFAFWFWFLLTWIYLVRRSKRKILHAALMTIISIVFFVITLSRTGILVTSMALLLFYLLIIEESGKTKEWMKSLAGIVDRIIMIMPTCCAVLSVLGTVAFNMYIRTRKDIKISSQLQRFNQFSIDCAYHGIKLPFPRNIEHIASYSWITGGTILTAYSDNIVHSILIGNGIIWLLIFLTLFQIWAIRAYRHKNRNALIVIFAISVFSVFEATASIWMHNVFLLLVFAKEYENVDIDSERVIENNEGVLAGRRMLIFAGIIFVLSIIELFLVNTSYILWGLLAVDILSVGAFWLLGKRHFHTRID